MPSRARAWGDTLVSTTLTGAQVNLDLLADLAAADTKTVVRLVGHLTFVPAEEGTAGHTVQVMSMGIQVVAAEAFAASVVPDPNVGGDVPVRGWLWRDRAVEYIETTNNAATPWFFPEVRFDLRAMRKVDRGVLVFTVNKDVPLGVAHDLRMQGIIRALCLT